MMQESLAEAVVVAAAPSGLWTLAIDYISGPLTLRLCAQGKWRYSRSGECGPDGDPMSLLSADAAQSPTAPIGALIAKIGGSSAGWRDGTIFLAGAFCLFAVPETLSGPLFLTMNDEFSGMGNNSGAVTATVSRLVMQGTV